MKVCKKLQAAAETVESLTRNHDRASDVCYWKHRAAGVSGERLTAPRQNCRFGSKKERGPHFEMDSLRWLHESKKGKRVLRRRAAAAKRVWPLRSAASRFLRFPTSAKLAHLPRRVWWPAHGAPVSLPLRASR